MRTYLVTVTQRIAEEDLDYDDKNSNPTGNYEYEAYHEEHALDQFHRTIPVANLDHFHITTSIMLTPQRLDAYDRFPIEDWMYEVSNGDTVLGYEDWLDGKIEMNEEVQS